MRIAPSPAKRSVAGAGRGGAGAAGDTVGVGVARCGHEDGVAGVVAKGVTRRGGRWRADVHFKSTVRRVGCPKNLLQLFSYLPLKLQNRGYRPPSTVPLCCGGGGSPSGPPPPGCRFIVSASLCVAATLSGPPPAPCGGRRGGLRAGPRLEVTGTPAPE